MVLGLSRSCVGLLHTGTSSRFVSPLSISQAARRYAGASATATKIKGRPTSKASATTSEFVPPTPVAEKGKDASELSEEELQLIQLEKALYANQFSKTLDPWGQPVTESLDVMIPRTGGLFNRQKFKSNIFNEVKNAVALYTLASHNSLPGLDFSNVGKLDKFMRWPLLVFDTRSVKPKSWLAPLRAEALRTYKQLNTAIASGDKKTAHSLTTTAHKTRVTELMNKYGKENGYTYIWRFHREVVPTQVLSIRTVEGYLANEEPKFGNRMLIHALVKFDTEQSLQIYDRNGRPLHKAPEGAVRNAKGLIPAINKRVTEYLVMEKRMWYDMPWVFRDQMWPNASAPQSTA